MGIIVGMVGIGLFFFFSMFIGGVIFLVGLGLEVLNGIVNTEDTIKERGLKGRFKDWMDDKTSGDCIILAIEVVAAIIVIYFLVLDVVESI